MRRIVIVSVALVLLVGCGGKSSKGVVVSGKVTYKGQPVNGAAMQFHGADGGMFNIGVDQQGNFRSSDVPPGKYKVVVQGTGGAQQAVVPKNIPPEKQAEVKEKLEKMAVPPTIKFPDKYKLQQTSDLEVTVANSGDQKLDLELKD